MERLEDFDGGKRYRIDLTAKIIIDAVYNNGCALGCPWLDNYHTLDCNLFREPLEEINLPASTKDHGMIYSYYKRCDKCLKAMSEVVEI